MRKRRRLYGPTAPPLGLLVEVEAANQDRLTPRQTARLLRLYRAGDSEAKRALIDGHRWLVYSACQQPGNWRREPWLGSVFYAMTEAVRRLGDPFCRKAYSESDVETYIRKELFRAILCYFREISPHILPPASTNSERAKKGEPVYEKLTRRHRIQSSRWNPDSKRQWVDPLEDADTLQANGLGGGLTPPERLQQAEENARNANEAARVFALAETPLEKTVLGMLAAGMSEREISLSLGISRHQVRTIIAAIRLRANQ